MLLLSEENKKTIIDLFCNTKIKVEDIINMLDTREKLTLEEFYEFLEDYQKSNCVLISRPKYDFKSDIDKLVVSLKEQGKGYKEIAPILESKGIRMDKQFFLSRYRNKYLENNEIKEARKCDKNRKAKFKLEKKQNKDLLKQQEKKKLEDEIYELKNRGFSIRDIFKHFHDNGSNYSYEKIRLVCQKTYKDRKEPIPFCQGGGFYIPDYIIKEIKQLRENGDSYNQILTNLNDKGYDISYNTIGKCCRLLEIRKNKKINNGRIERYIPDEELYSLKKNGLNCRQITDFYKEQHKKVSYSYVVRRCREIYLREQKIKEMEEKARTEEDEDKINIKDIVMKVAIKKKATQAQMKKFAEEVAKMYAIDLKVDYDELNCDHNNEEKEIEK